MSKKPLLYLNSGDIKRLVIQEAHRLYGLPPADCEETIEVGCDKLGAFAFVRREKKK